MTTDKLHSGKGSVSDTSEFIISISKGCRDALVDKKCENPKLLDLRKVNSYLDYFLICTGSSRLHCRALAKEAERFMHEKGVAVEFSPDYDSEWIVLDFNELIVHIFTQDMRDYYNLERLWGDAAQL